MKARNLLLKIYLNIILHELILVRALNQNLSGIITMSNQSKINNILSIAQTFSDIDSMFLLVSLNKCKYIFHHEFSLKNKLFNIDGIFNYVLTYIPGTYLNEHLVSMSKDEVLEIEDKFKSTLDDFYAVHDELHRF